MPAAAAVTSTRGGHKHRAHIVRFLAARNTSGRRRGGCVGGGGNVGIEGERADGMRGADASPSQPSHGASTVQCMRASSSRSTASECEEGGQRGRGPVVVGLRAVPAVGGVVCGREHVFLLDHLDVLLLEHVLERGVSATLARVRVVYVAVRAAPPRTLAHRIRQRLRDPGRAQVPAILWYF
ncbi:hypothetical protein DFH09DRAFT_1165328 [Mycena vulgaris]|nr:hypothetical protein DFH09DRAFT_1165328 [Mycena vulgaris]